jgi:hypothetical protein
MALIGTSRSKKAAPPVTPTIRLKAILEQLADEWDAFKADPQSDFDSLLVYYHCTIQIALHWIDGDPYTCTFPAAYQGERLAKLCEYLRGLQDAESMQVKAARERNLAALKASWPEYRDFAIGDVPIGMSVRDMETPPWHWEGLGPQQWAGYEGNEEPRDLPTFPYKCSADFHLASLAVLYLNRQLRYALTDLYAHSTGES